MSDDYRPRENDHLVEPMYEALREGETRRSGRGGRWIWWGIALLGGGVVLVVVFGGG